MDQWFNETKNNFLYFSFNQINQVKTMDTKWTQLDKVACDMYIDFFCMIVTNLMDFASDIHFDKTIKLY
jgi:hypothetical protein